MKNKFLTTAAVVVLCVGSIFLLRILRPDPAEMLKKRISERSSGDPKAKIWVTEYFDYQCPPCASAHALLQEWMLKNPGKIYLQVRYFPLPAHKHSVKAAIHAECATRQPGKFWKFHGLLFDHQAEWASDAYPELKFLTYAETAELDLPRWDACTKDPATEKFVSGEKAEAEKLGIKITPSFFVNGKLIVGTQALMQELNAVADEKTSGS